MYVVAILNLGFFFFFPPLPPSIFCCSHNSHHLQQELTKFGYRSKRKIEDFENLAMFWQPVGNYCQNMMISEFFFFKSGDFGTFFSQKSWYELHWIFFGHCYAKIHPQIF
jgi:hypothetical protein